MGSSAKLIERLFCPSHGQISTADTALSALGFLLFDTMCWERVLSEIFSYHHVRKKRGKISNVKLKYRFDDAISFWLCCLVVGECLSSCSRASALRWQIIASFMRARSFGLSSQSQFTKTTLRFLDSSLTSYFSSCFTQHCATPRAAFNNAKSFASRKKRDFAIWACREVSNANAFVRNLVLKLQKTLMNGKLDSEVTKKRSLCKNLDLCLYKAVRLTRQSQRLDASRKTPWTIKILENSFSKEASCSAKMCSEQATTKQQRRLHKLGIDFSDAFRDRIFNALPSQCSAMKEKLRVY